MSGWQDSFQPSGAPDAVAAGGWQSSFQPSEPAQPSVGMDMAKSFGSGALQGATAYGPMIIPTLLNQAVAGPQELYRGLTGREHDNSPMWQPFMSAQEVLPQSVQHAPETNPGRVMDFLGNLIGGAAAPAAIHAVGNSPMMADEGSMGMKMPDLNEQPNSGGFMSNNQSGMFPRPAAPEADAVPAEKLATALESAQQQTRFSRPTNALQGGKEANEAISHQYSIDKELQSQHYEDLNKIGSQFSMPANEVYGKLNDLTGYLKDKVSVDSPEYRAYTELGEISKNLNDKYGIQGTSDKTVQLPSWKQPMVVQKGEAGQSAYGMQPSDAVDIKTTLNQLTKSGKFTNAGQAKILEFKNYIQDFLNQASEVSPEFGAQLQKAETQAARVGLYRDPKLSTLWHPKPDYMSYKGETDIAPETFDRQANFLRFLNTGSPAAGESYSLAQILPHEVATNIFRNALLQNKQAPEGILENLKTLGGLTRTMGASPESPLLNLADQLRGMK